MKFRILIAGFGFMGQTHTANILRDPDAELAGIVDPVPPAERLATIRGNRPTLPLNPAEIAAVPHFRDLDAALEHTNADACMIALPTKLHVSGVRKALAAGLHTFVEKPFAIRREECADMVDAARKADRLLAVGYLTRHTPEYLQLREVFRSGACGRPRFLSFRRWTGMPAWGDWTKPEFVRESGGGLFDLMSHDIDFVRFCCGEPERLFVDPFLTGPFRGNTVGVTLRYAGFDVQVRGGFVSPASFPFRRGFDAWFENAALLSEGPGDLRRCDDDGVHTLTLPPGRGDASELSGFIRAARTGDLSGVCTGADAAKTIDVCLAVQNMLGGEKGRHA